MNKLAIITGGSKGLGLALVKKYGANNFQVISIARSKSNFIHPNLIACITFDLSEIENFNDLKNQLFTITNNKKFDEIVLINNAATLGKIATNENNSAKNINKTIKLNLTAPLILTTLITKHFKNIKTAVYNISSGAAIKAYFGWSNYCATKAGLSIATKTIALEQENNSAFKIFSIIPGVVDTQMQTEIRKSKKEDFNQIERFIQLKEQNLLLNPDDVATKIFSIQNKNYKSGTSIDINDIN